MPYRPRTADKRGSPPLVPRPLYPQPCLQPYRPKPSFVSDAEASPSASRTYTGAIQKPFPNPHEALCHFYNVADHRLEIRPGHALPSEIDMPVLQDAHMPTHVLAITDTAVHPNLQPNPVPIHPILAPINAELFATKFTNDVAKLSSHYTTPGTLMPIPYWDKTSQSLEVTLPLIPLVAPHPESLPLLIFYGMSLHHTYEPAVPPHPPSPGSPQEHQFPGFSKRRSHDATPLACSCTGLLATYLLPTSVIEEFPAANVMAAKMSDLCTDEQLDAYMDFNRGFWRNVLSLAPTDTDIIDIARIAWNVTKEARWIRASRGEFESGSGRRPSVSSLAPPPSPL